MLNKLLSDAVIINPHGTLMVIAKMEKQHQLRTFSETICGVHNENVIAEDADFYELAPRALERINERITKLGEVDDPLMADIKKRCLNELDRNKIFWENEKQNPILLSPLTPKKIKEAIETHGVEEVSSYIWRYISVANGKSEKLLNGIRSGKDEWLDLFGVFRGVSDAMWSELLDGSIGYALSNNPGSALKVIDNRSSLCSQVDEGWEDWGNGEKSKAERADGAINELNKRIKGVMRVKDDSLLREKKQCLDELEKSKRGWAEYKKVNEE